MMCTNSRWNGYEPVLVTISHDDGPNTARHALRLFMLHNTHACMGMGLVVVPVEQYLNVEGLELMETEAGDIDVVLPDPASIEGVIIKN